jgi:hypothetical protein
MSRARLFLTGILYDTVSAVYVTMGDLRFEIYPGVHPLATALDPVLSRDSSRKSQHKLARTLTTGQRDDDFVRNLDARGLPAFYGGFVVFMALLR